MENELISIIVPIFNVAPYLEKCVNSIINQTYKNLEIILVDDGSTDESASICDKLKEKDNRIIVIHKENGGLSDARNAGMSVAKGDYFGFVDSDDYIDKTMYEKLYKAMRNSNSNISLCNYDFVYENGELYCENPNVIDNGELTKDEFFNKLFIAYNHFYVVAWNKLYDKEIFNSLEFEKGRLHEDEFIIHKIIDRCNKVACIEEPLYFYVQRDNSIMNQKKSVKNLDVIDALYERYLYFKKNKQFDNARHTEIRAYSNFLEIIQYLKIKENFFVQFKMLLSVSKMLKFDLRIIKLWICFFITRSKGKIV